MGEMGWVGENKINLDGFSAAVPRLDADAHEAATDHALEEGLEMPLRVHMARGGGESNRARARGGGVEWRRSMLTSAACDENK